MVTSFSRIAAVMALVPSLGMAAVWVAGREPELAPPAQRRALSVLPAYIGQLELSDAQKREIDAIGRKEEEWVRRLERALAESADELRRAELAQPFDETLVAALVGREAEIGAHLRGAQSRVVSKIVEILTPAQRRQFGGLRLDGHIEPVCANTISRAEAPRL